MAGKRASHQPYGSIATLVDTAPVTGGTSTGNRAMISRFADIFYRQKEVKRALRPTSWPDYVQHNPQIADGRSGAIAARGSRYAARTDPHLNKTNHRIY